MNRIPIKLYARAYELYQTTDMTLEEISRALMINSTTLRLGLARLKSKGYRDEQQRIS